MKKIKLTKPFVMFEKMVNEVILKEPNGGLYMQFGEPRLAVVNGSGSAYWVEQPDTIAKYLDRVIDHESGSMILSSMSLEDAMAVKEGLFSFFEEAAAKRAASKSTS